MVPEQTMSHGTDVRREDGGKVSKIRREGGIRSRVSKKADREDDRSECQRNENEGTTTSIWTITPQDECTCEDRKVCCIVLLLDMQTNYDAYVHKRAATISALLAQCISVSASQQH